MTATRIFMLVIAWTVVTLAIAAYAVLKPDTTTLDLFFVPRQVATTLDLYYDARTLFMTLLILAGPGVVLTDARWNAPRRCIILFVLVSLVGFELMQLLIPSRGFGWPDLGYTLLAGVIVEAAVVAHQMSLRLFGYRPGREV